MCTNKYVDFVSDEHFIGCVNEVCTHYSKESGNVDMKWLQRNGLDSFKMIFDIMNAKSDLNTWIGSEAIRQMDKTISNWIGDFHQSLLGGVEGWTNLKKGHSTGVDLMKEDETKFMELKNKHNTTKGEDLKNVFSKLEKVVEAHPNSTAYYAYITPKNGSTGEKQWKIKHRNPDNRIRTIWGSSVYGLVTGDSGSLEKTWKALPMAINDVLGSGQKFSGGDSKNMTEIFRHALKR